MAWRDRERSRERETRDEKGRTKRDYVPSVLQGRLDNGLLKQSAPEQMVTEDEKEEEEEEEDEVEEEVEERRTR